MLRKEGSVRARQTACWTDQRRRRALDRRLGLRRQLGLVEQDDTRGSGNRVFNWLRIIGLITRRNHLPYSPSFVVVRLLCQPQALAGLEELRESTIYWRQELSGRWDPDSTDKFARFWTDPERPRGLPKAGFRRSRFLGKRWFPEDKLKKSNSSSISVPRRQVEGGDDGEKVAGDLLNVDEFWLEFGSSKPTQDASQIPTGPQAS
jgi:hypothetical protein